MTVIAAPVWSELITIAAGDLVDGAAEISNSGISGESKSKFQDVVC
jgi:hypothetical protein